MSLIVDRQKPAGAIKLYVIANCSEEIKNFAIVRRRVSHSIRSENRQVSVILRFEEQLGCATPLLVHGDAEVPHKHSS